MRTVNAKKGCVIPIGRLGENEATAVVFDVAEWLALFGEGTFTLLAQRNADATPYPCVVERDGDKLLWNVKDADVSIVGYGKCELIYTVGDTVAKSEIYTTVVGTALTGSGEVPEPYEDWVQRVVSAGASAIASAETASEKAQTATNAAMLANRKAFEAENSAQAATNAANSANSSAQSANASKESASTSAEQAAQSAENALESKNAASSSASVAVSAKNTAVSASEDAESAKNAAQLAEVSAQTAKDKAEEAAEHAEEILEEIEDVQTGVQAEINAINEKIPEQASAENQLADKDFVNSSIATNTANYISDNGQPFASKSALDAYSGTLTNNDYAFVVGTDAQGNVTYTRYKYNANEAEWAEEYVLNNSSFTAAQWATINSGITALGVEQIEANRIAIAGLLNDIALKANDADVYHEWQLAYDGATITKDIVEQTFTQIANAIDDRTKFVYVIFQNRLYIPQYRDSSLVSFSCSYLDGNTPTIRRIRMTSAGAITTTVQTFYNKTEIDTELDKKADADNVYTKDEVDEQTTELKETLNGKQDTADRVDTISNDATKYPSAKAVWDYIVCGNNKYARPTSADLNGILATGFYSATGANRPDGTGGGSLIFVGTDAARGYGHQIFLNSQGDGLWTRFKLSYWRPWRQVQYVRYRKTVMDNVAVVSTNYFLGTQSAVNITLPSTGLTAGNMITVVFYSGATAATLSVSGTMLDFDYVPSANSRSEINALWDGTYWTLLANEQAVTA